MGYCAHEAKVVRKKREDCGIGTKNNVRGLRHKRKVQGEIVSPQESSETHK